MNIIEEELKTFKKNTISLRTLPPKHRLHYFALKRMLIEKELEFSKEEIMQLAKRIKPLMRPKLNSSLAEGPYWTKPEPLRQSFYFNFKDSSIVTDANGKIIPVVDLEKVAEFTCYHKYGGHYTFLRPGLDEVIQQFPRDLLKDTQAEYAIELVFPASSQIEDIYDAVLDRHISTVVVYRLPNGFPPEIKNQEIIWE